MKQFINNVRKRDGFGGGKIFPAVLFLFMILLSLSFIRVNDAVYAAVQAGGEIPVTMGVSYGFSDTAKGDRYLPVRVSLENQEGENFSGMVEILTTESSMEVYRYDYPVSVDASGNTEEIFYIPLGIKTDQIFVTLRDRSGSEIIKKRLKLNINSEVSELFIGLLSSTPADMTYLDGVGVRYGSIKTKLVGLNKATIPEDPKGFDQLDLIIVNDYSLNELSEKQKDAMIRWVEEGGTVLFGGGTGYQENMGSFLPEFLIPPYETPVLKPVNLGAEYSKNAPQDAVLDLICVDLTVKDGRTLLASDGFAALSAAHKGSGGIAVSAFDLRDIKKFCLEHPSFSEKLLTLLLGENKIDELSHMEYYGYSQLYFSAQGLINTGNVDRLPNVFLYTVTIIFYILLIGPGLYLLLKKKSLQRFYIGGVAVLSLLFTAVIYIMGVNTRFREPFFNYAAILDASGTGAQEEIFINVRSPFNKPYAVALNPDYVVRPITKSYYYDYNTVSVPQFTGEEMYKTAIIQGEDQTELRIRDTAAFIPKMFSMSRDIKKTEAFGIGGSVQFFDGKISGKVVNRFDYRLEDAALLLYGKAVLLGDIEPGQEVTLDNIEVLNYPLNYAYAFAQAVAGADQYDKADITDKNYMLSQERTRILSFYMDNHMADFTPQARLVAFSPDKNEKEFLADKSFVTEGITLVTSSIPMNREQDGFIYRSALEQDPVVVSGSYNKDYNSIYASEPSEPVVLEYSLGNELELERLTFEPLSPVFDGNTKYPYLSAFKGKMYFYNYDTGHNDLMEQAQTDFTLAELRPYLSPSNTITIKYVSEEGNTNGYDKLLPMLYVIGRVK